MAAVKSTFYVHVTQTIHHLFNSLALMESSQYIAVYKIYISWFALYTRAGTPPFIPEAAFGSPIPS